MAGTSHQRPSDVVIDDRSRIGYRLTGTGDAAATLRVYIERFEPNPARHGLETEDALTDPIRLAGGIAEIKRHTGRDAPTVVT